ncbi:MAG: hypothetical protein FWE80_00875 [Oscillospiraceae bacterium]|nr:hypothetical protein [Oscillospiraceae bacterium]
MSNCADKLYEENKMLKNTLDNLIKEHKVQPVGSGYTDCIISFGESFDFINALSNIGINVYGVTWWCHCKNDVTGCPHGMGGPLSLYYDGWFSEMWYEMLEFDRNEQVISYLNSPKDKSIFECFVPALWPDVPEDWINEGCRTPHTRRKFLTPNS